ncbi:hypothetical protein FIBSPDRAFT_893834 [Athelia psychrophila]|uniref:Uncharacterized protein n=1 Tax=Athelia psychrophila TaxID=1759441 RepID=A0A166GKG8_9AGAM|nr:hypothetical protein FIBSPDRAFT_893834 [Fibularhizoctonia sp. CBS 109695]
MARDVITQSNAQSDLSFKFCQSDCGSFHLPTLPANNINAEGVNTGTAKLDRSTISRIEKPLGIGASDQAMPIATLTGRRHIEIPDAPSKSRAGSGSRKHPMHCNKRGPPFYSRGNAPVCAIAPKANLRTSEAHTRALWRQGTIAIEIPRPLA